MYTRLTVFGAYLAWTALFILLGGAVLGSLVVTRWRLPKFYLLFGLAHSLWVLLASRLVQGVGGGITVGLASLSARRVTIDKTRTSEIAKCAFTDLSVFANGTCSSPGCTCARSSADYG